MLTANIYRSDYRSPMNVCDGYDRVVIVNIGGPAELHHDHSPVMLVAGAYPGLARLVPATLERVCVNCDKVAGDDESAEPICSVDGLVSSHSFRDRWMPMRKGCGPMMGGSYVAAPDSRFVDAVEEITGARFYGAIALHDRFETTEQYAEMSS